MRVGKLLITGSVADIRVVFNPNTEHISSNSYCTAGTGKTLFGISLSSLRAMRQVPHLDCARLALLRPGDSVEQLQTALGDAWLSPRPKDDGWWRPARRLDGFMARIGPDARLMSVCFYGHFSMRCRVENLQISLPLRSAQTRQPSLRRLESVSGPRRDVHYMCTRDGHHLYVQIYRSRIWRLCLEGDAPCPPST